MRAGEVWRGKREAQGKTLDDVSLELRVSRRYLEGIEEGNYAKWPPKVFSAGFIRAYARLLGEDPEPVLSEYYDYLKSLAPGEVPGPGRPQWIERERLRGSRRTAYWAAAGAVLAAGIFLAWLSMRTAPRPVLPPEAPEVSRTRPPEPPAAVDNLAAAEPAPPADAAPVRASEEPSPLAATAPEGPPSGEPLQTAASPESGTPLHLLLEASELTWVMYSRDGGDPVDVMLYPGDRFGIEARESLYLKLGNAGGVAATLNGEALPPFGKPGEVKEVRLGE